MREKRRVRSLLGTAYFSGSEAEEDGVAEEEEEDGASLALDVCMNDCSGSLERVCVVLSVLCMCMRVNAQGKARGGSSCAFVPVFACVYRETGN